MFGFGDAHEPHNRWTSWRRTYELHHAGPPHFRHHAGLDGRACADRGRHVRRRRHRLRDADRLGPFSSFLNTQAFARFASYDLSVIPLFILMGHFATQGGISKALFGFAAV
jgi:hypothetical protein